MKLNWKMRKTRAVRSRSRSFKYALVSRMNPRIGIRNNHSYPFVGAAESRENDCEGVLYEDG
jgi:hypothetical protein